MEVSRKFGKFWGEFSRKKSSQDASGPSATEYLVMGTIVTLCLISVAGLGSFGAGIFNTAALGW